LTVTRYTPKPSDQRETKRRAAARGEGGERKDEFRCKQGKTPQSGVESGKGLETAAWTGWGICRILSQSKEAKPMK